jgi:hypothetical protein
MGIIGKILPIALIGAAILYFGNIISRPAEASASAGALGETGSAIGRVLSNLGSGASELGMGIGEGGVGLLKPFWEVKNLMATVPVVYDSTVAGAANSSAVAQSQGETVRNVSKPSSSTITWSNGTSASVPTLSAAAKSYYGKLGVSVT